MGGYGSGQRYNSKKATSDMWRLDVYYLHKHGMLAPGRASTLSWSRNGEQISSIGIWAEDGRITLKYRTRSRGGEWEDKEYPVALEIRKCGEPRYQG